MCYQLGISIAINCWKLTGHFRNKIPCIIKPQKIPNQIKTLPDKRWSFIMFRINASNSALLWQYASVSESKYNFINILSYSINIQAKQGLNDPNEELLVVRKLLFMSTPLKMIPFPSKLYFDTLQISHHKVYQFSREIREYFKLSWFSFF